MTKSYWRTPTGDRGHPYNFFSKGVQNWLKFSVLDARTLGPEAQGRSFMKLCHVTCC